MLQACINSPTNVIMSQGDNHLNLDVNITQNNYTN